MRFWSWVGSVMFVAAASIAPIANSQALGGLAFSAPYKLSSAGGGMGTEPRAAVAPNGARYVLTDNGSVYRSANGLGPWTHAGDIFQASQGSIDVDITATSTGRLVATTLSTYNPQGPLTFRTSYSDDQGVNWTAVSGPGGQPGPLTGTGYFDQDRPYLAAGPNDPTTHLPRVYSLAPCTTWPREC